MVAGRVGGGVGGEREGAGFDELEELNSGCTDRVGDLDWDKGGCWGVEW